MSVINANPLMLGDAGYNIQRSLRFRSSASAYLSRTHTAGNRKTWTWSGWVKRGLITSGIHSIFTPTRTAASDVAEGYMYISSDDTLTITGQATIF